MYGAAPTGTWAAPGRVNLIGEHTDYNDGFVLPFALPHTALRRRPARTDGLLRLHSGGADGGGVVDLRMTSLAAAPEGAGPRTRPASSGRCGRPGTPVGGADLHYEQHGARPAPDSPPPPRWRSSRRSPSTTCTGSGRSRSGWPSSPSGRRTPSSACPAGSWTRPPRPAAPRAMPCSSTPATSPGVRSRSTSAAEGLRLLVVDTGSSTTLGDGAYAERRAGCERGARALGVRALRDVPYAELPEALDELADEPSSRPSSGTSSPRTTGSKRSSPGSRGPHPRASARCSPPATPRCATTSSLLPRTRPRGRHRAVRRARWAPG